MTARTRVCQIVSVVEVPLPSELIRPYARMTDATRAELSREDLRVLHQALNEVLHGPEAIERWEFDTRMGTTREEALALLHRVEDIYRNRP